MNIDSLNADFGIADIASFETGNGGLPMLRIANGAAEALISVYGGQVLTFRPRTSGRDLLFLSEHAYYAAGKAIKGGVPICWPWFGPDPLAQGRPAHGIARNRMWSVYALSNDHSGTHVTLGFDADDTTRALWPYEFTMRLHISVGASLGLVLETANVGAEAFDLTQALHTYFRIGDIHTTTVEGLDGTTYLDKTQGGAHTAQSGAVRFAGEVDSVYGGVGASLAIVDAAQQRRIEITDEGSATAVVWNPWAAIAKSMADLADDDYLRFVCVETANAGDEVIRVEPGTTARMAATYRDVDL